MGDATRRTTLLATGTALAAAVAGCTSASSLGTGTDNRTGQEERAPQVIGDGSTSYTGSQPNQPTLPDLAPGKPPPQFVVFSWDGGGETDAGLLSRFRTVARDVGASMTIFLSGLYLLRGVDATRYHPPRHEPGRSDIPFLSDESVRRTIVGIGESWREGHEIGTHFNGHFCSGAGSVARWSAADWTSEIEQAVWMTTHWRTTTGWSDLPSLPFDYTKELVGARTPCLLGSESLIPAAARLGWRYDSSSSSRQVWPHQFPGTSMWNLSLSQIPFPGHSFEVLAMDYNYMANQSGPTPAKVATRYAEWKAQALGALLAGHERALSGNRAPLIVGNHFEQWNGGIYMDAVEEAMRTMAKAPDTYLVSFRQLVDWLDRQDPILLAALQSLDVGKLPEGGWAALGAE